MPRSRHKNIFFPLPRYIFSFQSTRYLHLCFFGRLFFFSASSCRSFLLVLRPNLKSDEVLSAKKMTDPKIRSHARQQLQHAWQIIFFPCPLYLSLSLSTKLNLWTGHLLHRGTFFSMKEDLRNILWHISYLLLVLPKRGRNSLSLFFFLLSAT